jgi:tetratricopeptide (TPR) repeat protein
MDKVSGEEAQDEIDVAIEKALALGPNLAEVQFTVGEFSARREEALTHFDRAIEINPNYGAAYVARAHILESLRRYRESFEASEIAFRVDPLSMLTAETALYAHFYQGKTDRLEERLEASIQNQPTANGLVTEAHIRFELGQFDLFPFLQRRAEEIPGFGVEEGNWIASAPRLFGDTYLTLGLKDLAGRWMVGRYDDAIFLSDGRYDEAIEFLKTEFETGKDKPIYSYRWHPDIIASLVEAYLYAGRYDELTAFLDALSWQWGLFPLPDPSLTNPPWPEVAYTFALFQTGRATEGQEWLAHLNVDLEHRLAEGIDVPNHYYELARIRAMQGRVPEAFAAMERAIEKGWRRWYFDLDPILEPIRKLPEFAVLKMQYDADIARLHDVVAAALAADTPGTAQ